MGTPYMVRDVCTLPSPPFPPLPSLPSLPSPPFPPLPSLRLRHPFPPRSSPSRVSTSVRLATRMAVLSVCAAFTVRTIRIDGSQLLHTWQLFDWTIDTTIPTASIIRVSLCKMERRFSTTYFCRVTAADGKQLDFGGHLSKEENVWLQHEVSSYLLSLAAESV
ncbi:unnamed protein product [Closterium sp. Yama58-4]|nr:unnamed protein product [Closterium sp. Yama58-4]